MEIKTLQALVKRTGNSIAFTEKYIDNTWQRYLSGKNREDLKSYWDLKRELAKTVAIQRELKNELRDEIEYQRWENENIIARDEFSHYENYAKDYLYGYTEHN